MARKQSELDQLKSDLSDLFKNPAFRRVLREMMKPGSMIKQSSYGGDARESAYLEGRKSFFQDQVAILDLHSPYAFLTLLKEEVDARRDETD